MIDWLTILVALVIIVSLVGFFGFLAWKINISHSLTLGSPVERNSITDSSGEKRKAQDQTKKKRKEQKKGKSNSKDEDNKQKNKSKEPSSQTSEETDDEHEESEQELLPIPTSNTETSSKARKRNKNKAEATVTVAAEKTSVTPRAPPSTHPKSGGKDENGNKQGKAQSKQAQAATKSTGPTTASPATGSLSSVTKKTTTQTVVEDDQPFTVVGGNKSKNTASTPSVQQVKPANSTTTAAVVTPVQQEPLVQRQQVQPVKETTVQSNVVVSQGKSTTPVKIADLVKNLPSSQVATTELMLALDAFPLSSDELEIIMHKIANKQAVIKQDWTKLQLGQKVDPEAQVGQAMNESTKAYQDDMKNNSLKRLKELSDELNNEKRRSGDLLKEKLDKERQIEILRTQLDSLNAKQANGSLAPQLQRLSEENLQLRQQLSQQQESNNTNASSQSDTSNAQLRVLSEQMKKLSVDNANLGKKADRFESMFEEVKKEKDNLQRYNEQLTQSLDKIQKQLQDNQEVLSDTEKRHLEQVDQYKTRVEQLELDNEQLRCEDIVHVEPSLATDIQTITLTNEERDRLEDEIQQLKDSQHSNERQWQEKEELFKQRINELEQFRTKFDDVQNQREQLEKDIENLRQELQSKDESRHSEIAGQNAHLDNLRSELDELKTKHQSMTHQLNDYRRVLTELLPQDVHSQISEHSQDFHQWLLSYRTIFQAHLDTTKKTWEDQCSTLKSENERLHKNMSDVENQLKDIEQTVQTKEELLLSELKTKDTQLESIRHENEHLNGELQKVRSEIERVQLAHDGLVKEARLLKVQLDERFLVAANTPPVVADESFELIKQPSPSLSPIVIDIRAEQLNELIRSSNEALENQDSITQQLAKHLDDLHRGEGGESSTSNVDESNH